MRLLRQNTWRYSYKRIILKGSPTLCSVFHKLIWNKEEFSHFVEDIHYYTTANIQMKTSRNVTRDQHLAHTRHVKYTPPPSTVMKLLQVSGFSQQWWTFRKSWCMTVCQPTFCRILLPPSSRYKQTYDSSYTTRMSKLHHSWQLL